MRYEEEITLICESEILDEDYVKERVLEFAKRQAMHEAFLKSIEIYESHGETDKIEQIWKEALSVGGGDNLGINLQTSLEDFPDKLKKTFDRGSLIQTQIPGLDDSLLGGVGKGELHILMAASGGGKSKGLAYLTKAALLQSKSVLHITFEISEEESLANIVSSLTGMGLLDLIDEGKREDYKRRVERFKNLNLKLMVKEFPNYSVNCNNLRAYIMKVINKENFKPDIIFLDYADLILPIKKIKSSGEDSTYEALGTVFYDIINLAKTFQVPIWTASQTNRGGWNLQEEGVITMENIADSARKAHTAHSIVTINSNATEKRLGKARLYTAKVRRGKDFQTIHVDFDRKNSTIKQIEPYTVKSLEG